MWVLPESPGTFPTVVSAWSSCSTDNEPPSCSWRYRSPGCTRWWPSLLPGWSFSIRNARFVSGHAEHKERSKILKTNTCALVALQSIRICSFGCKLVGGVKARRSGKVKHGYLVQLFMITNTQTPNNCPQNERQNARGDYYCVWATYSWSMGPRTGSWMGRV